MARLRFFLPFLMFFSLSGCDRPGSSESSQLNDLDTELTTSGRAGARYVYYLGLHDGDSRSSGQKRNTRVAVFRGLCPATDLGNRDKCRRNLQSVGLDSFFSVVLGSGSSEAIKAFATQFDAENELASAITAEYAAKAPDLPENEKQALLDLAKQNAKEAGKKAKVVDRIGRNLKSFFDFLGVLASEEARKETENSAALMGSGDKEKKNYLLRLNEYFEGSQLVEGRSCSAADRNGRFVSEEGGCRDTHTNIVWGPVARSFNGFSDDTWYDRDSAASFCANSSMGGRYDWELASEDELTELAKGGFKYVGLTEGLHYWSSTEGEEKISESIEAALPERKILSNESDVLLGYSTYQSSSSRSSASSSGYSSTTDYSSGESGTISSTDTRRAGSVIIYSEVRKPWGYSYSHSYGTRESEHSSDSSYRSSSSSHAVTGKSYMTLKAIERSLKGKVHIKENRQSVVQMGTAKSFLLKRFSLIGAEADLKESRARFDDKPLAAVEQSFSSSGYNSARGSSTSNYDGEGSAFYDGRDKYFSFSSNLNRSGYWSSGSSSSSESSSSSVTKEVGRSRSVEILRTDVERVNPLNFVAYELPKDIRHNIVSVVCKAKGAVKK